VIRTKPPDNTIQVLASRVADPTFVVAFVEIYRELALVMIAIGTLKQKFVVGPIIRTENISQYLEFFVFHLASQPVQ